jgi:hypothetical protein
MVATTQPIVSISDFNGDSATTSLHNDADTLTNWLANAAGGFTPTAPNVPVGLE